MRVGKNSQGESRSKRKNVKNKSVEGAHEKLKWYLVCLFLAPSVFSSSLDQGSGPSFLLSWYILPQTASALNA